MSFSIVLDNPLIHRITIFPRHEIIVLDIFYTFFSLPRRKLSESIVQIVPSIIMIPKTLHYFLRKVPGILFQRVQSLSLLETTVSGPLTGNSPLSPPPVLRLCPIYSDETWVNVNYTPDFTRLSVVTLVDWCHPGCPDVIKLLII